MRSCLRTALLLYMITSGFFKAISLIGSVSQSLTAEILGLTCISLNSFDFIFLIIILSLHYHKKQGCCSSNSDFHRLDYQSDNTAYQIYDEHCWFQFWLDHMKEDETTFGELASPNGVSTRGTGIWRRCQSFGVMASWFQAVYLYPIAMIITGWILSLDPSDPPTSTIFELVGTGIGFMLAGSTIAIASIFIRRWKTSYPVPLVGAAREEIYSV